MSRQLSVISGCAKILKKKSSKFSFLGFDRYRGNQWCWFRISRPFYCKIIINLKYITKIGQNWCFFRRNATCILFLKTILTHFDEATWPKMQTYTYNTFERCLWGWQPDFCESFCLSRSYNLRFYLSNELSKSWWLLLLHIESYQ